MKMHMVLKLFLGADHSVCGTVILRRENSECEFEVPEGSLHAILTQKA